MKQTKQVFSLTDTLYFLTNRIFCVTNLILLNVDFFWHEAEKKPHFSILVQILISGNYQKLNRNGGFLVNCVFFDDLQWA